MFLVCLDVTCRIAASGLCIYSASVGEQNIVITLSVCLSVHEYISGTAGLMFNKFFVQNPCGRDSVLLWQHCNMLVVCTSSCVDDVSFGRSWPYGNALRYQGGV